MASSKLAALPDGGVPAASAIFYGVENPSTSEDDVKITLTNLAAGLVANAGMATATSVATAQSAAVTAQATADAINTNLAETIRDRMGLTLVQGANVTITVNDPGDTITIAATGGGGGTAATTTFNPAGTAWVSTELQSLGAEIDTTISARVAQGIIDSRAGMALAPIAIYDPSDTAARNSGNTGTTITDDPVLVLTAVPVGTYRLDAFIGYDSGTTPDFKCTWSFSGTATASWAARGVTPGAGTSTAGQIEVGYHALTDVVSLNGGTLGANIMTCSPTGFLKVTVAGDLKFRWAQATSDASNTIRKGGSGIVLTKIA